jgi:hypothetical protein
MSANSRGASDATDTIVRPDALGATTLLQLRSSEAPTSFSWEVGLGQINASKNSQTVTTSDPRRRMEPGYMGETRTDPRKSA